jgi:hypothetical protein
MSEQVRFCKIEDDKLMYTPAPSKNPFDESEVIHEVIFERGERP